MLALLFLYVYGMLGWILFGDELPERWGDIGDAMLTLFTVFTLEGWNDVLYEAQEVHPWSWVFFISFVLLASLLLINILIAIIINAMEEAREAEQREEVAPAERGGRGRGRRVRPAPRDRAADRGAEAGDRGPRGAARDRDRPTTPRPRVVSRADGPLGRRRRCRRASAWASAPRPRSCWLCSAAMSAWSACLLLLEGRDPAARARRSAGSAS